MTGTPHKKIHYIYETTPVYAHQPINRRTLQFNWSSSTTA